MARFRLILAFFGLAPFFLFSQNDTLRLVFAGDIMGHGPLLNSAKRAGGAWDFQPMFDHVRPVLEAADLAIGNLELTLPGKPPYQGYPMFRAPDEYADALKTAGFDVIVTANNHSNDGGLAGVEHTIDVLKEKGFFQTGTFKNGDDRSFSYPLIVYKNGFKIAFLNATYGTNGIPDHAPTSVNLLDTLEMRRDFETARAMGPDFIIVVAHWGLEYQLLPNAEQKKMAQFFAENGADLIVGAHPHVVQPIDNQRFTLKNGDQKDIVVAWSLGNFISNQQQPNTDGGILFRATLVKNSEPKSCRVVDHGYLPVFRFIKKTAARTTFLAVPESEMDSAEMPESEKTKARRFFRQTKTRLEK